MLHKTRAIVLKTTKYSETSIIVQALTEKFGLQSYLFKGVRSAKSKTKAGMFQPLYLLDMVVYHKESGNIQQAKEVKNFPVFTSIPFNVVKSSLALFLNEVIYRSVKHQGGDQKLFDFLFHTIQLLDTQQYRLQNFHLVFLVQFSKYLGFYPKNDYSQERIFFDLRAGGFLSSPPPHPLYLEPPQSTQLAQLLTLNFEQLHLLHYSTIERKYLLGKLIEYYQYHIEGMGEVKSHMVLEEILM